MKEIITTTNANKQHQPTDRFKTYTLLYYATPLNILGSVSDDLSGYCYPLAIKGVINGLATLGFIPLFGWSALLSALPVLALEGTVTLGCACLVRNFPQQQAILMSVNSVAGLLVFVVALVILQLKKIELADYLPSLFFAPLLTYFLG